MEELLDQDNVKVKLSEEESTHQLQLLEKEPELTTTHHKREALMFHHTLHTTTQPHKNPSDMFQSHKNPLDMSQSHKNPSDMFQSHKKEPDISHNQPRPQPTVA